MMKKGESYGESSGVIFTSFSEVSTRFSSFFSPQIAHKMQMTHHLTHYSTPPQHGCAIFAKHSHGPSVHGVLMTHLLTHRTYNCQNRIFGGKSRLRLIDDFFWKCISFDIQAQNENSDQILHYDITFTKIHMNRHNLNSNCKRYNGSHHIYL